MIVESPELVAVARRWLTAQQNRDSEVLVGLFSKSDHLRYIGTGHGESWAGDFIRQAYPEHSAEIPRFLQNTDQLEAFEDGTCGWAHWQGTLKFENIDEPKPLRISWIFTLEKGSWKVITMHLSTPRANMEVAGHEHFAFRDLIKAAGNDPRLSGREGTSVIMFTDIVGSTSINEAVGDRVWATTIGRHIDSIQNLVEAEQGILVKSLGDGTMSSFLFVENALNAAIAVQRNVAGNQQEPLFEIRIGIHAGDVIKTSDDFVGTVVNTAARLTDAATQGQILVSEDVVEMATEGEYQFGNSISLNIRGIEGTSAIAPLIWK